jgi:hypothetical protein
MDEACSTNGLGEWIHVAQDRDEYDNETLATEQAGNNLLTG